MNADRLLALYEKVAEAPDAVTRLRRFVLDLAVRGKLVAQEAGDEPASELLKRIAAEKARLVKAKAIRKLKPLTPVATTEHLTDQPQSWGNERLGNLSTVITKGSTPTSYGHEFTARGINFLKVESIVGGRVDSTSITSFIEQRTHEFLGRSQLEAGDILFSIAGSIGTCALVTPEILPANTNQALAIIRGTSLVYEPDFLILLLRSFVSDSVKDKARGGAMNNVSLTDLQNLVAPLPPLAEQRRIVAKVEELMALLDRLEAAGTAREATRDRLTAASLARLTSPDFGPDADPEAEPGKVGTGFPSGSATTKDSFPANARFALATLPALTTRPDQIKSLRQTILNLAVRGKLVAQDPTDEPLPRIDKGLPPDTAAPFDIPKGWQWSRLRALGTLKGGGTPSKARDDFWNGHIPWVSPKDMKVDYINAAQLSITDAAVAGSAVNLIGPASVLFVVRGMILAHSFPVAISKVPLTINQDMKAIVLKKPEMAEYILRALKGLTPEMLAQVQRSSHGTCRIEGSDYGDFLIPLPPLAEQHRIVAKVNALMALCDRLEAALTTADTTRARLLEALLHEALEPAAEAVTEAAE